MSHALIVEDDPDAARMMARLVEQHQFTVATAGSLRDARKQLALHRPDVMLLDLQLPDGSGMELFKTPELIAHAEVVLITGHASLETSIQALRLGATDYLIKPVSQGALQGILSRVMKPGELQAEISELEQQVSVHGYFGHMWGRSTVMRLVYQQIARVAATSISVLITGESGSGKEVVARSVHDLSRRRQRPFLAVNCGAISTNLIESEIFGHEKGSFTGADTQHQGFFERAHGGTLFLDEITEMPMELQVKLLRVLETGTYMRVGSTQQREADVRVIAATNRSPAQAVTAHKLREDLFYRLNVFPIELPPKQGIDVWIRHAGMDWQIESAPVHFTPAVAEAEAPLRAYPDQLVLYRSDTQAPLSIVSDRYHVVQPREVLEFYRDLTEAADFELETAGVLKGGRRLWALARTGQEAVLPGQDRMKGYLLLATSCDGTLATTVMPTSVRVVCNNTLRAALDASAQAVKVPHCRKFDPEQVKKQLGLAVSHWDRFIQGVKRLAERPVEPTEVEPYFRRVLGLPAVSPPGAPMPQARALQSLQALYGGEGRGADLRAARGTTWGLVNAVTEFVDHHRRAHSPANRLDSAWFGHGAALKDRAFDEARQLAEA